jgi:hypothetical protein
MRFTNTLFTSLGVLGFVCVGGALGLACGSSSSGGASHDGGVSDATSDATYNQDTGADVTPDQASADVVEEPSAFDAGSLDAGDAEVLADGGSDAAMDAELDAAVDRAPDAFAPCLVDASSPWLVDAVDIAVTVDGQGGACAVRQDGSILCWGLNSVGSYNPFPVDAGAPRMVRVAVTYANGCSLDADGGVWCWGINSAGELGNGAPLDAGVQQVPTRVVDSTKSPIVAVDLTAGADNFCALTAQGEVLCWGEITAGTAPADAGTYTNVALPVPGLSLQGWRLMPGGYGMGQGATYATTSCAISGDAAACWGAGTYGDCLNTCPNTKMANALAEAGATTPLTAIASGEFDTCALDHNKQVWCWGANNVDQRGSTTALPNAPPTVVDTLADAGAQQLAVGYGETCVIDSARHVECIGWNIGDQLGNGSTSPTFKTPTPTLVVDLDGGVALSSATRISIPCVILQGSCGPDGPGQVVCWGGINANHGLYPRPVPIPLP